MSYDKMTNPEFDNDEITIDLTELFMMLWSEIHIILLAGILTALLAFVGTKLFITPLYTSTTQMYVLTKQDNNSSVTYTDLQTGTQLTKDYMVLIKSRPVLEQVISVLNLDMEVEVLADMISVETETDTRVLNISVKNEDPRVAKQIADAVREAVGIQITEIMDAEAVNTVQEGNLATSPSSPSVMKNVMIGGILGLIISIGIFVLIFVLDDTIKTPDDVEQYLGLNVLTSIPMQAGAEKNRSKKVRGKTAKKLMKNMKK